MKEKKNAKWPEFIRKKWLEARIEDKYPVWSRVDISAIKFNISQLKTLIPSRTKVMAVLKADAYGHGAVKVAEAVEDSVECFGVGRTYEAIDLRENGMSSPILIFGYTSPGFTDVLIGYELTQTVYDYKMAKEFSEAAVKQSKKLKVHIKLDTGMGRLGIFLHNIAEPDNFKEYFLKAISEVERISSLPGLDVEGIYTHFAIADSLDFDYAGKQLVIFSDFLLELEKKSVIFPVKHCAGTSALLSFPNSCMDMVRPGKLIYGILPECCQKAKISLKQALSVESSVVYLKNVPKGTRISYSSSYFTEKNTVIATIPAGFADGFVWESIPGGSVLVRGQRTPIIGRVCMDFIMVEAGHIEGIRIGDEVIIVGKQGNESISLNEMATRSKTIPTNISTFLTARTKKIYF